MNDLVSIQWAGRPVDIEIQWVNPLPASRPLLVFLHEGLGSVALWRDFPGRLCTALGCTGLVYSRPGYGTSTPREPDDHWGPDFLHRQAYEVLPALLDALSITAQQQPIWLFGHSDGASIALLFAARFPERVSACVAMAPHVWVEDISITSIQAARLAYLEQGLKQRLTPFHNDPDSAFWGWNDIWLDPQFRSWCITQDLTGATCKMMALQGRNDEYGTLDQLDRIAKALPHTQCVVLDNCRHSPHRDQPQQVIEACQGFFNPMV